MNPSTRCAVQEPRYIRISHVYVNVGMYAADRSRLRFSVKSRDSFNSVGKIERVTNFKKSMQVKFGARFTSVWITKLTGRLTSGAVCLAFLVVHVTHWSSLFGPPYLLTRAHVCTSDLGYFELDPTDDSAVRLLLPLLLIPAAFRILPWVNQNHLACMAFAENLTHFPNLPISPRFRIISE